MESVLQTLLEITVYSAVLFAGILLLKGLCGKKMSPILHYALWLVLLMRLVIPTTIDSSFSVFTLPENAAPIVADAAAGGETVWGSPIVQPQDHAGNGTALADAAANPASAYTAPQRATARLTWAQILTGIWLVGMAGCLVWLGVLYISLRRRIRKNAAMPSKKLLMLLEEVKRELGIRSNIRLLCLYEYGTPALLFPNTILMPVDALAAMNAEQVKFALRHELTHFKRGDQFMNVLLSLLNAIYWFNPIVWIAFRLMRSDMETACDSMVTRQFNRTEKNDYANLILSLFSQPAHRQIVLGMAEANTRKVAEQRIRGIFMRKSSKPVVKIVSIVTVLILMVGCFTTACVPKQAEAVPAASAVAANNAATVTEKPAASVSSRGDYGVATAIDGDTVTATTAQGETYRFNVNELPLPEGSLAKPDGCVSAAEAVQKAAPLLVAAFPELTSPCDVAVQFSYFDYNDGHASQGYELYFGGTDYESAQYLTGISTLDGDPSDIRYVEALFPGEPEAVTDGLDFDWDANYKEEYATRALELAKELIQDKIAPDGEIKDDSFIDGVQVAFSSPDLFALDAKIHMADGASYVVQYLMPSERIKSFSIHSLGWHAAIWGYTDPAEEKAYPSLDGSYTWEDADAYTEAQNAPPEGQMDITVTEEMYEAIAKAAEGMIGETFEPDLSNVVGEEDQRMNYIFTFAGLMRKLGYGPEPLEMSSGGSPIESPEDAKLQRGREITISKRDDGEIKYVYVGIWLGEDTFAYANYDTRRVERRALTAADFTENTRVRVENETTLRVSTDASAAPTPTPDSP